ncbi:hypothetical protein M431DRAFT_513209 [Trichoderma harzianum CBS 226.95]|uniref:Uncharacterized protein n=1 Tax=Trichoderma harzianum CBS 226.95 TaxID=983964 RepID=A0A2T3ZWI9_TRIHA|nr:hypothetical protein M431DRAFT_513209 [Trichoderma harzianum CBS 226.95]PTB49177.1 hypothetical protein M431DRAFT_513209 [Trichoderma harzianum CBS 226.95]
MANENATGTTVREKREKNKRSDEERKIAGGGVRRRAIEVLLNLYVRRKQRNWG